MRTWYSCAVTTVESCPNVLDEKAQPGRSMEMLITKVDAMRLHFRKYKADTVV
jgi:hypothetical protein